MPRRTGPPLNRKPSVDPLESRALLSGVFTLLESRSAPPPLAWRLSPPLLPRAIDAFPVSVPRSVEDVPRGAIVLEAEVVGATVERAPMAIGSGPADSFDYHPGLADPEIALPSPGKLLAISASVVEAGRPDWAVPPPPPPGSGHDDLLSGYGPDVTAAFPGFIPRLVFDFRHFRSDDSSGPQPQQSEGQSAAAGSPQGTGPVFAVPNSGLGKPEIAASPVSEPEGNGPESPAPAAAVVALQGLSTTISGVAPRQGNPPMPAIGATTTTTTPMAVVDLSGVEPVGLEAVSVRVLAKGPSRGTSFEVLQAIGSDLLSNFPPRGGISLGEAVDQFLEQLQIPGLGSERSGADETVETTPWPTVWAAALVSLEMGRRWVRRRDEQGDVGRGALGQGRGPHGQLAGWPGSWSARVP